MAGGHPLTAHGRPRDSPRSVIRPEGASPSGMMSGMDQGTAAVLGACVGVVGTIGTAVLTFIAARTQVRDQGMIEHRRTVRTERRDAYRAFMTSISNVEQALENQMLSLAKLEIDAAPLPAWRDTFTASDELSAQLKSLKVQAVDILLAGPVQHRAPDRPRRGRPERRMARASFRRVRVSLEGSRAKRLLCCT